MLFQADFPVGRGAEKRGRHTGVCAANIGRYAPARMENSLALDFDTPRIDTADRDPVESLESLVAAQTPRPEDLSEDDTETLEMPGLEPVLEELQIIVIPVRRDEFTCQSCFMIKHRAQRASGGNCRECAD